jgi:hypothetical protein
MMLEPNIRVLLTQAFRAPTGYRFDCGLAATYTLDLTTLLGAALHLSLFGEESAPEDLANGIALLEALRRISTRLGIFCQNGHIAVPKMAHVLYGLLEPMVVPVAAPLGGVFHPKLWVLRFVAREPAGPVLLRLLVLSRNLTPDRSWDVSLALEGAPTGRNRRENEGLRDLVASLPALAQRIPEWLGQQTSSLAEELHTTEWQLPPGFDEIQFHALGLRRRRWRPPASQRLAVISPFCSAEALEALTESTAEPALLISRPEDLDKLGAAAPRLFQKCMVLREAAETEDGEDTSGEAGSLRGLHAKVYISQAGWDTRILIGSANATKTALLDGRNVELLAELRGKRSKVGGIDDLLSPDGLGNMLEPYVPRKPPVEDEDAAVAKKRLEQARTALSSALLGLSCEGEKDCWQLTLQAGAPVPLEGISGVRVWPISLRSEHAVGASALRLGKDVPLPACSLAAVTGFIAFELAAGSKPESCCFVLNLPVKGLPEERRAAVVRTIVASREGFLKYLLFLLADLDEDGLPNEILLAVSGDGTSKGFALQEALPLLEEMTRALSRDPDRLRSIQTLIEDLTRTDEGREMVPEEFLEMWRVYAAMLPEVGR